MSKLNIVVDMERVELDDMIALENKTMPMTAMRNLLAKFVVDEKGAYIPFDEACKLVGKLNMRETMETAKKFSESMQGQALPTIGDGL